VLRAALVALVLGGCSSPPSGGVATSAEETSTTAAGEEAGELFVSRADLNYEPCDPFAQDCPSGHKCVPFVTSANTTWDANKCVPVLGDEPPGAACVYADPSEGTDNCDASSLCWNAMPIEGELVGTCHRFCAGSHEQPECPEGEVCPIAASGVVTLCTRACDPLAQDCGLGLGCFWGHDNFHCVLTALDIPAGEPCGFVNDCAAGLLCVFAGALPDCAGSSCCTAYCEHELGDAQCDALPGTSCVPFFSEDAAPAGYEHVGLCVSV
jgi:hypothetical protein